MFLVLLLALCLTVPPVEGPIVVDYDPSTGFAGHWGVDIAADPGTEVRSPADGTVTFAGRVAGMQSVTIRFAETMRVSLSYLSSVSVSAGDRVSAGTVIGRSGTAHGTHAVHVSVRVGSTYVDPAGYLQCRRGIIRLLPDR